MDWCTDPARLDALHIMVFLAIVGRKTCQFTTNMVLLMHQLRPVNQYLVRFYLAEEE